MADLTEDESDSSDKETIEEAKERYKICVEAWADNRKWWLEDAKFREPGKGNQWPEDIKKKREAAGLPCLEVDKLNQYVRQVVNDGRQNRPGVKVRPEGDGANTDAAEAWEDFIRGICARSNADEAYDTSLDHAAGNGYGFFRVVTEYSSPGTFNQEIKVKRVRNPLAIYIDPFIQNADGSDARFGFVEDIVPKDDFKKKFPKAKKTDWTGNDASSYKDGWLTAEGVRVCEYWYQVETMETVHLLKDGTTVKDLDYQLALKEGIKPPEIQESRELPVTEVKWCKLSGAEILDRKDWLGRYIPILMVIGNESDIEGKVTYSGLVRPAKDAQRLHNYDRASVALRLALGTKAPWMAAEEAIDGHSEWDTANSGTHQVLKFRAYNDAGQQLPQPQRIEPADFPVGYSQGAQASEHDIQGAMGMYNASLGEKSNEKSGRAIMARQREGDTGTFHYPDNLNRAIRFLGRIIVDLAPKVYDSPRVIHLLGQDGTVSQAQIDPNHPVAMQQVGGQKIFNPTIGVYGVDISSGPSYTTKRQEAADAMLQLTQANPAVWQTHGDLIVKSQDWPGADEFAERSKLVMPPQLRQVIEQGEGPQALPPQVQQAMQAVQQGQQQLQAAQQELTQIQQHVGAEHAQNEAEKAKLEAAKKELDAARKVLDARYNELSAKLELQAMKIMQPVPQTMPAGKDEPAIDPSMQPPQQQPAPAGFLSPGGP